MLVTDWKAEFDKLNEYRVSLERNRADLWGINEELREKIGALERGQEDLQAFANGLHQNNSELRSSLAHAHEQWKLFQAELQQEKYEHAQSRAASVGVGPIHE